jgi:hypothetical protein
VSPNFRRPKLACALALLLLAGCGPGVGGTGTGEAPLAAFDANEASVCSGAFAAALACPSLPTGPAAAGTEPVQFVDAAGQVTLEVSANLATLDAACLRLRFSGEFGVSKGASTTTEAFFGSYEVKGNGIHVLAALSAVPQAGGALTIELRDIDGRIAVGPVLLRRATTPRPAPNPC